MILVAFLIPVLFIWVKYILKKVEVEQNYVIETSSINRIANSAVRLYNPAICFSAQKNRIYAAAASTLNETTYKLYQKVIMQRESIILGYKNTVEIEEPDAIHAVHDLSYERISDGVGNYSLSNLRRILRDDSLEEGLKIIDFVEPLGQKKYKVTFFSAKKAENSIPTNTNYDIYKEDKDNLEVSLNTEEKTLTFNVPKEKRKAVVHIPECNANIILAVPTNSETCCRSIEPPAYEIDGDNLVITDGKAELYPAEQAPITIIARACGKFLEENFANVYGITAGVIPYSGKVSLDPYSANLYLKKVPVYDIPEIRAEKRSLDEHLNNGQHDPSKVYAYWKQAASYGSVGKEGNVLNKKEEEKGGEEKSDKDDSIGVGVMYRQGRPVQWNTITLLSGSNGENSTNCLLLNNSDPRNDGQYYQQMPYNPCYAAHCNIAGKICEKNCPAYIPNPYHICGLTDNVIRAADYLRIFTPFEDRYNKSNFLFLPLHWAKNLIEDWAEYPETAAQSGEKIGHPKRKDKKNFVIIVVNKPSAFEPHEMTYLGFDNDNAEIPVSETDSIAFKLKEISEDPKKWKSTKELVHFKKITGSSDYRENEGGLYCNGKFRITLSDKNLVFIKLHDADCTSRLTICDGEAGSAIENAGAHILTGAQSFNFDGSNNFFPDKQPLKSDKKSLNDFSTTGGKNFGHNLSTKKIYYKASFSKITGAALRDQVLRCYAHYGYKSDDVNKKGIIPSNAHCRDTTNDHAEQYTDPCIATEFANNGFEQWEWNILSPQLAQVKAYNFHPICYGIQQGYFAMTSSIVLDSKVSYDENDTYIKQYVKNRIWQTISRNNSVATGPIRRSASNVYQVYTLGTPRSSDYTQIFTGRLRKRVSAAFNPYSGGQYGADWSFFGGTYRARVTIPQSAINGVYGYNKIGYSLLNCQIDDITAQNVEMIYYFNQREWGNRDAGISEKSCSRWDNDGSISKHGSVNVTFPRIGGDIHFELKVHRKYNFWHDTAGLEIYLNGSQRISRTGDRSGASHFNEDYFFYDTKGWNKWNAARLDRTLDWKHINNPDADFEIELRDVGNGQARSHPCWIKITGGYRSRSRRDISDDGRTISYCGRGDTYIDLSYTEKSTAVRYDLNNFFFLNTQTKTLQGETDSVTDASILRNEGIYIVKNKDAPKIDDHEEGWICFCGDGKLTLDADVADCIAQKDTVSLNSITLSGIAEADGSPYQPDVEYNVSGSKQVCILPEQIVNKDDDGNFYIDVDIKRGILESVEMSNQPYRLEKPKVELMGEIDEDAAEEEKKEIVFGTPISEQPILGKKLAVFRINDKRAFNIKAFAANAWFSTDNLDFREQSKNIKLCSNCKGIPITIEANSPDRPPDIASLINLSITDTRGQTKDTNAVITSPYKLKHIEIKGREFHLLGEYYNYQRTRKLKYSVSVDGNSAIEYRDKKERTDVCNTDVFNDGKPKNTSAAGYKDEQGIAWYKKALKNKWPKNSENSDISEIPDGTRGEQYFGINNKIRVLEKNGNDIKDTVYQLYPGMNTFKNSQNIKDQYAYTDVCLETHKTAETCFLYNHKYIDTDCIVTYGLDEVCDTELDANLEISVKPFKDTCGLTSYENTGKKPEDTESEDQEESIYADSDPNVFYVTEEPICTKKYTVKVTEKSEKESEESEKQSGQIHVTNKDDFDTVSYNDPNAVKVYKKYDNCGNEIEAVKPPEGYTVDLNPSCSVCQDIEYCNAFDLTADHWQGSYGNYTYTISLPPGLYDLTVTGECMYGGIGSADGKEVSSAEGQKIELDCPADGNSGSYSRDINVYNCKVTQPVQNIGEIAHRTIIQGNNADTTNIEISPSRCDYEYVGEGYYMVTVPCENAVITGAELIDKTTIFEVYGYERGEGVQIFDFTEKSDNKIGEITENITSSSDWIYGSYEKSWCLSNKKTSDNIFSTGGKSTANDFFIEFYDHESATPGVSFKFGSFAPEKIMNSEFGEYTTKFSYSGTPLIFLPYGIYNIDNGAAAKFAGTGSPMSGVFAGFTLPYNFALANNGYQKYSNGTIDYYPAEALKKLSQDACSKLRQDGNTVVYVIKYGDAAKDADELDGCDRIFTANSNAELTKVLREIAADIKERADFTEERIEVSAIE